MAGPELETAGVRRRNRPISARDFANAELTNLRAELAHLHHPDV
jgi:hypothetical protein